VRNASVAAPACMRRRPMGAGLQIPWASASWVLFACGTCYREVTQSLACKTRQKFYSRSAKLLRRRVRGSSGDP
jgi:hypothetical protein